MAVVQKLDLSKSCWKPQESYNFRDDTIDKCCFKHSWLKEYAPWLTYSHKLKGALCLHRVLFHQNVVQGVFGAFIVTPFDRYERNDDIWTSEDNRENS